MTTTVESNSSEKPPEGSATPSRWMNVGLIAMASVVLGGMATAWWYKKTLIRLRQAQDMTPNPEFWISEDDLGDDI